MEPKYQNLMPVLAMSRTGHTAIVEWIQSLLDEPSHFVIGPERDPLVHYQTAPEAEWHIWNFEDFPVEGFHRKLKLIHVPDIRQDVIIVRSLANWFASLYVSQKKQIKDPKIDPYYLGVRFRKLAATRAIDWGTHVEWAMACPSSTIIYDAWFCSYEYRRKVAERFGEYKDYTMSRMSRGGSSFDGGSPKMRYGELKKDELFWELYYDYIPTAVRKLDKEFFGEWQEKDYPGVFS